MNNKHAAPKAIGERITIEATQSDKSRKYQGEGFFVEVVTPSQITLRRDYADGTLKTK